MLPTHATRKIFKKNHPATWLTYHILIDSYLPIVPGSIWYHQICCFSKCRQVQQPVGATVPVLDTSQNNTPSYCITSQLQAATPGTKQLLLQALLSNPIHTEVTALTAYAVTPTIHIALVAPTTSPTILQLHTIGPYYSIHMTSTQIGIAVLPNYHSTSTTPSTTQACTMGLVITF